MRRGPMRRRTIRRIRVTVGRPEYWVGLAVWLTLGLLVGYSIHVILAAVAS